jgi:predicted CoA-binding protein
MNSTVAPLDFRRVFDEIRTIVVVGYSDNPQRAGHYVPQYFAQRGFEVIAVNPKFSSSVDGLACFPSLSALPEDLRIDVVDVFRAPEHVPALVEEAGKLNQRPRYFWMQPGAESQKAAERCEELGIIPIMHACMLAEHRSLKT